MKPLVLRKALTKCCGVEPEYQPYFSGAALCFRYFCPRCTRTLRYNEDITHQPVH
jgi:hypothetical protein